MKKIIFLLLSAALLSCSNITNNSNSPEAIIRKNLESRFTGFEIVETKPDKANIYTAINKLNALELKVASTNAKIIHSIGNPEGRTPEQNYLHVTSLQDKLTDDMTEFESSKFDKVDPCYYVKFLMHNGEDKVPIEEYYFIDKNNGDVLHRPFIWEDFLIENGYNELVKEALRYYDNILDMRGHHN